jgi:hypothetical protein
MRAIDAFALAIWTIWLLLSILVYVPALTPHVRQWDLLALVPEWKFFAPHPPQHNYHLLYRDISEDQQVTGWKEVALAENRRWWNFIWNPGRRARKAFFDVVSETARQATRNTEGIEASVPYLTLLVLISKQPRTVPATFTQFLILLSKVSITNKRNEVLLLSAVHSL